MLNTDIVRPFHLQYPFDTFNPLQEVVVPMMLNRRDCNFAVCAPTASGKTVVADLAGAMALYPDKPGVTPSKLIYVGSHKSLVEEKSEDWAALFPDARLETMTGDYSLSERKNKNLHDANIIMMTPEMLDSRLRNFHAEQNGYLKEVGALVLDEFHLTGMKQRGDKLEAALMEWGLAVPNAKIVALSATMSNVDDIKTWFEVLVPRPAEAVVSTYRPCQINMHFHEIRPGRHNETEDRRIEEAIMIMRQNPNDQFLIFTGNKIWGRAMLARANRYGFKDIQFHNADLGRAARKELEQNFRDGKLQHLIATTTVAWGCNLPARRTIIAHQKLGIEEMDPMDLQQMIGRTGRPKFHKEGDCYIICEMGDKAYMQRKVTSPCIVRSQIGQNLPFHILSKLVSGDVKDAKDLQRWYSRSLAMVQQGGERAGLTLSDALAQLAYSGMVNAKDVWAPSHVGKVASRLYMDISDSAAWLKNFRRLRQNPSPEEIAIAFANIPSCQKDYVSNADRRFLKISHDSSGVAKWATAYFDAITGEKNSAFSSTVTAIKNDIERIGAFLQGVSKAGGFTVDAARLARRVRYGVPEELLDIVVLPKIGATRARTLVAAGIRNPKQLVEAGEERACKLLGKEIGKTAFESAKNLLSSKK